LNLLNIKETKLLGRQHISCLSQARLNWEGCGRKGIRRQKREDDGGVSLIRLNGVAPIWIVGVSASAIFPFTIKSSRRFLLALAHLGSPGKMEVKWLCVFMCVTKY